MGEPNTEARDLVKGWEVACTYDVPTLTGFTYQHRERLTLVLARALAEKDVRAEQAERKRDAERTRYVLADAGWKEMNRQVAALEADLAAMRGVLEQVRQNVNDLFTSLRHVGAEPDSEACAPANAAIYRIDAALASSPGAAPRAPDWGGLHEFQTAEAMPEGWLATAREVVEALAELVSDDRLQTLTPPWRRARALLARPEVKAWTGR